MNIIRKYKLSLLKYDFLTKKELEDLNIIFKEVKYCKENFELIEFIYNNLLNLKQVKLKDYPNDIFYFKDDKVIFEQYLLNTTLFFVNYYLIWGVFETKFNYNYQEIRNLIKRIVEQSYKMTEITPRGYILKDLLQQAYKLEYNEHS